MPTRKQSHFTPELFTFLRQLKRNNNREWFQKNKSRYEQHVRDPFLRFIEDFRPELHKISPHFIADPRPSGGSLLRIYRDMRFRPDGDPYQTMAAARFPHEAWKQTTAPGFYLHLAPGSCFLGCGMWHPNPEPRNRVRQAIVNDPAAWKKGTTGRRFKSLCELSGEISKRMPPGFDPEHPLAEDLRRKDYITVTYFTDEQITRPLLSLVTGAVSAAAPLMKFLTRSQGLPWAADEKLAPRDVMEVDEAGMK